MLVALTASGCSDDSPCVTSLNLDCAPLYEPVYEQIFTRTIEPRCAVADGSCHAGPAAQGGLRLDEIDLAYENLVTGGRVLPGDASCSLVVARIEGQGKLMPPGRALPEAERCTIEQWIENGAAR